MSDPIKIIWKYKNNHRRVQYNTYIFIGKVKDDIMKILEKISELNLYTTWQELTKADMKKLETVYGDYWYNKFFNTYHVHYTISLIRDSSTQKKELHDKMGDTWIKKHIEEQELIGKKLLYTYESLIRDERSRKTVKKGRTLAPTEDELDQDYTTYKKNEVSKVFNVKNILKREIGRILTDNNDGEDIESSDFSSDEPQKGGMYNDVCKGCKNNFACENCGDNFRCGNCDLFSQIKTSIASHTEINEHIDMCGGCNKIFLCNSCELTHSCLKNDNNEFIQEGGDDFDDEAFQEDDIESNITSQEEEIDMAEIEELYKNVDVEPDDDISKTTNLIKKALNDDKIMEKNVSAAIEFDTSKDNNMYDENLKDSFKKFYVTQQYIHTDDTIKTIKDKICSCIKNNGKFDKDSYLMPSRQYLWSEYYFNNKIEKIMIGQKWIRRNELLNVDVEPNNNLRFYEELRSNLKLLRDNIKRYGNKIRFEDDETNILYDYEGYITSDEIYMIDIYNELGQNFNPDGETLKNLQDVYFKLYFHRIKSEDVKYIIDYLNNDKKVESGKMTTTFDTINNDLIMNNEIMNVVENVKITDDYKKIFKENFITQSVIHVNLRIIEGKIDLYRIFNEFDNTEQYPFLQYQTPDGTIFFKFREDDVTQYLKKKDNADVLSKWFENSPYGISFKVKVVEKNIDRFIAINLNENGRIEYKTQWKEEDMATIDDIKKTYTYVNNLIKKINSENNKVKMEIPEDSEYKYAFINTIQKFELPGNHVINHNDLSEFSRYFYPYIALVIEPRKRQAKVQKGIEKSKFGTYLRYKRVSKYENQQRLEQRIMYFLRNYEYNDQSLSNEISKQFNITEERAMEEIDKVRMRYPNIKLSRKFLKKLENIPKYKPPGIGIDVQGKQREKYKIRISGARDKYQLDRIINFMNILIHLYIETYIFKNPERAELKNKLKELTNIAKRRSKVDDIVRYSSGNSVVKQMTQMDKKRIGFKPEKGQNQWTRSCQNSGNDKKRRPQQFNSSNMSELLKAGYSLNKKTGAFERRVMTKINGKKKEVTLKTIKLSDIDDTGNLTGDEIHYSCSPEENGDHFYVGFLTRSANPHGFCMPCCFKKDPAISKNKEKREFFQNCLNPLKGKNEEENKIGQKSIGDKLYILQDTNKIQEGRFGFLPKYLDFYFNGMLDNMKKIRHHYLIRTDTGYFFKYGSKQEEFQFLNAVANLLDLQLNDVKNAAIRALENDRSDLIFISLNNGDIKTQFETREKFIDFIKYSNFLDFDVMNSILSIPRVLANNGLNILIFQKKTIVIKKTLEKEKIKDDFYLLCQNIEDVQSLTNPSKESIFLLKENKNYYPIVMVKKDNELTKNMSLQKTFKWTENPKNIVNHVKDFYERNCHGSSIDDVIYKGSSITARETYNILNSFAEKEKKYLPKYQVIDVRNKCKYLITNDNLIVPVRPSGSIYNLPIVKATDKYIDTFDNTLIKINNLYTKSEKKIPVKAKGVYFDKITEDKTKQTRKYKVIAIITKAHGDIPIIPEIIDESVLEKNNLLIENKPLYDKLDKDIAKGRTGPILTDDRIEEINYDKYYNESYELFRLEFSDYINRPENSLYKGKLDQTMNDEKIPKSIKVDKIRLFMYRLIDRSLYDRYKRILENGSDKDTMYNPEGDDKNFPEIEEINDQLTPEEITDQLTDSDDFTTSSDIDTDTNRDQNGGMNKSGDFSTVINRDQNGGKFDKLVHIINKVPDLTNYNIANDRSVCSINKTKDQCNIANNAHCHWSHTGCYLSLTENMIITFVNKISEELGSNDLKALEIMKIGNYFVSDIVDYNRFTERPNQKIIRSSSNTIKKVLNDLFGKENVPKIGKRRGNKGIDVNYQQMNNDYPLKDMRDHYVQHVMDNNLSIFRAYVNGYHWQRHPYYDIESRNLGYYSPSQTDLANYFRSLLIDWLQDKKNKKLIDTELVQYMDIKKSSKDAINDFLIKIGTTVFTLTNCIVELFILNKIQEIPIFVYNDDNNIIYCFDNGMKYNHNLKNMNKKEIEELVKKYNNKSIHIKLNFITQNSVPDEIDAIYY